MTLPAQKFREIIFQLLYSHTLARSADDDMVELLTNELSVTKKTIREGFIRLESLMTHLKKIDALIEKASYAYDFDRIQTVEKNILRLGVFELLFDDKIPPKVAIAEAIRLCKKFSTKESASFVNAILDAIYQSSLGHEIDKKTVKQSAEALANIETISLKISNADKNFQIEA